MHVTSDNYELVRIGEIEPQPCPCGQTRRAFVDDPAQTATQHVVDIQQDSKTHYHKKLTEIYYVLEGTGEIELDGEQFPIQAGDSVLIKPGCRHRAIGKLKVLNVSIPAFDPADEWFD
ncbi:MAG: cupin domain-containing protein [Pirellulales bacterium]|nr:cupin domain-containing protein [Pirellulales bacterium]